MQSDPYGGCSSPKGVKGDPYGGCLRRDPYERCSSPKGVPSDPYEGIARTTVSSSGALTVIVERPRETVHDVECCRSSDSTGCGTETELSVEASPPPDTSISCPSPSTPPPPDQESTRGVVLRPGLETDSRGAGDPAVC